MTKSRQLAALILPCLGLAGFAVCAWRLGSAASLVPAAPGSAGSLPAPAVASATNAPAADDVSGGAGDWSETSLTAADSPSTGESMFQVAEVPAGSGVVGPVASRAVHPFVAPGAVTVEATPPDEAGGASVPSPHAPSIPSLPVILPLAALEPVSAMSPGDLPSAALDALRQNFAATIVGATPDDPSPAPVPTTELVRRWRAAQPTSDQMFRLDFGWTATMQQQLQVFRQTVAQSAP